MAIFENIPLALKDGSKISLRSPAVEDAQGLIDHGKAILNDPQAYELQGKSPEEFTLTLEEEKDWIQGYLDDPNKVSICAYFNEQVVGMIHLHPESKLKKFSHVVGLGMAVDQKLRGNGLGKYLMNAAVEWVYSHPTYEKIQLHVVETNAPAMALYYQFGFEEEGRFRNQLKLEDGVYRDVIFMAREL